MAVGPVSWGSRLRWTESPTLPRSPCPVELHPTTPLMLTEVCRREGRVVWNLRQAQRPFGYTYGYVGSLEVILLKPEVSETNALQVIWTAQDEEAAPDKCFPANPVVLGDAFVGDPGGEFEGRTLLRFKLLMEDGGEPPQPLFRHRVTTGDDEWLIPSLLVWAVHLRTVYSLTPTPLRAVAPALAPTQGEEGKQDDEDDLR